MNFSNFYENNKEALTQADSREALRRAWQDGYIVATKEMYKQVCDGLRGEEFTKQANRRAPTKVRVKIVFCETCDHTGPISGYKPCVGYNDIRCPKCGSTKNEHNKEYMKIYRRKPSKPK